MPRFSIHSPRPFINQQNVSPNFKRKTDGFPLTRA